MLADVVVDTNVFLHAQNPGEKRFEAAKLFLECLLAAKTKLCVDGVFDLEAPHRSLIAHEYLSRIPPTGPGYAVLVHLLTNGRVKMKVPTKTNPAEKRRQVIALIPRNPRDRTFVFVASNSEDRILVSHDWADFTSAVRSEISRLLDVIIEEAADTTSRLVL